MSLHPTVPGGTPPDSTQPVSAEAAAQPCPTPLPLLVFVHGSAELYGSDKVLLNLSLAARAEAELWPVVVLHEDGPLRMALAEAGIEVHVATVVKVRRAMFTPSAPLVLFRLGRAACADFDRIVRGRAVGLVYSNTLAVLGGAWWARQRGHRHLWHVHEIIMKPALVRRVLPWLADRLAQRVITNSTLTQAWLLAQAPRLARCSTVIFNGLPALPPASAQAIAAFRARIGAQPGDVVATVAGRLNHWKGQGLLIEALGILAAEGRLGALRVAIVGNVFAGQDHIRVQLENQVRGLKLEQRVCFVSFVEDIYSVWRGSQIAVVPSIEPEPFGMVAIEAMACGLPVVAAAHGGLLDIVEPGSTGLLFEPRNARALADALARLAGAPDDRQRWGEAGAARQRTLFSVTQQQQRTREVYGDLMSKPAPAR